MGKYVWVTCQIVVGLFRYSSDRVCQFNIAYTCSDIEMWQWFCCNLQLQLVRRFDCWQSNHGASTWYLSCDRLMHAWHIKLDIISGQIFGKLEITCHSWIHYMYYVAIENIWIVFCISFDIRNLSMDRKNYHDLSIPSLLKEKVSEEYI